MSIEFLPSEETDEARAAGESETRIPIAISSEAEVERYDWWTGERYIEVLDHSSDGIDLRYAAEGLPFFFEHSSRLQVGIVEDLEVGKDKKLRGWVRFGNHPDAVWIEADMRGGIRKQISVGYKQLERTLTKEDESGKVYRVAWMPYEASSVAIPADTTVGVGRSAEGLRQRPDREPTPAPAASRTEEDSMTGTAATATDPGAVNDETRITEARDLERQRVSDLVALANEHGQGERVPEWVKDGISVDNARAFILDEIRKNPAAPTVGASPIGLTNEQKRKYSLASAVLQAIGEEPEGIETEISRTLRSQMPGHLVRGGNKISVVAPIDLIATRALNTQTATEGAEAVFDEYAGFLDLLRTRAMVLRMGAQTKGGLQGNPTFVKQTGDPTATWVAEDPGADVADSQPAFTVVQMTPNTLMANVPFTRQELRQAVLAIQPLVEGSIVHRHARGLDLAAIHGSGAGNQPLGIYGITGVNPVAFGGAITYPKVVEMETAVAADDADVATMAYLTTPEIRGSGKTTQMFSGTNGMPIWTGSVEEGEMNGYKARASNQVAKTLGGGSEHGIIFGNWNSLMIGEWGVLELIVDELSLKKRGIIEITSFQMVDVQVEYPESFAVGTGLTL